VLPRLSHACLRDLSQPCSTDDLCLLPTSLADAAAGVQLLMFKVTGEENFRADFKGFMEGWINMQRTPNGDATPKIVPQCLSSSSQSPLWQFSLMSCLRPPPYQA
jgi:hypothetical protein